MRAYKPVAERFESKYAVCPRTGCWLWTAVIDREGYGKLRPGHGRGMIAAHRFSYEFHKGPIPLGLHLDHLCRNRRCVNPDHLEAVTQHENWKRGQSVTAEYARQTHCHRGHPFSPENTHVEPSGSRSCRKCACLRSAAYRARKLQSQRSEVLP